MIPAFACCLGLLLPFPPEGPGPGSGITRHDTLDEVIVTATRTEKKVDDVGRSVSVIGPLELMFVPMNNPARVLSSLPGVYIVGEGQNPGAVETLYMRGANGNETAIFMDGIRLTDPSTPDEALDLAEVSLADVEKIEVVRGAHSPLYGSSAMGGVVNFITAPDAREGLHLRSDWQGGTFGTGTSSLSGSLFATYAIQGFSLHAGILNEGTRGLDATVDTVTLPGTFQHRDKDNSWRRDWVAEAGYRNPQVELSASYRNLARETDLDKGAFQDQNNSTAHGTRELASWRAAYHASSALRLRYLGSLGDSYRHYLADSSLIDAAGGTDKTFSEETYRTRRWSHELQLNWSLEGLTTVGGIGIARESMATQSYYYSNLYGPPPLILASDLTPLGIHATEGDAFIHTEISGALLDSGLLPLSLAAGARWTRHSQFGSNVTFEAGPAWRLSAQSLLYADFAGGFNAPSLYELYAPAQDPVSGITRGNARLQPERSRSFELGFRSTILAGTTVSVAVYHTVVDHEIEYVYLWNAGVPLDSLGTDFTRNDYRGDTYLNLGTQTTDGIEFSFSSELLECLSLSANASLLSGKLEYAPSALDPVQTGGNRVQLYNSGAFLDRDIQIHSLVRRPDTFNARLAYRATDALTVQTSFKYVGSRNDVYYDPLRGPYGALGTTGISTYALASLSMTYAFSRNVSAGVDIENLLNRKYSEIAGYTTRGRSVYAQMQFDL